MGLVADDFAGQQGNVSRERLFALVKIYRNRYQNIGINRLPATLSHDGGNFLSADFQVLLTGGQGWLPEQGRMMQVQTTWLEEGGEWKLWRAQWDEGFE